MTTHISRIEGIYMLPIQYGRQPSTPIVLHIAPISALAALNRGDASEMNSHDPVAIKIAEDRFPELAPFVIG